MTKINTIDTLSVAQQVKIIRWYLISKRIILTLVSLLALITFSQWYLLHRYAPSCKPCITQSYADTIGKMHTEKTTLLKYKKAAATEQEKAITMLKNYLSFITEYINQNTLCPRLTDLRLTSQGFEAHYSATHPTALQNQLKELTANAMISKVSLNTIEQKNNTLVSSFGGTWKETKPN